MSQAPTITIPTKLMAFLKQGGPAGLATIGEAGWPHVVMTWAVARDEQTVRFIVDFNTTTSANLERDDKATLLIIGPDDLLFTIKGRARQVKERVNAASFAIAMMELTTTEIKDQSWPVVRVTPLAYEWLGDKQEALAQIEQAVLAELREWEP